MDNSNIEKKILIIGNGFDLAHGLPTTYMDFLEFAGRFRAIGSLGSVLLTDQDYINKYVDTWDGNEHVKEKLKETFKSRRFEKGEKNRIILEDNLLECCKNDLDNNIWYDYFIGQYEKGKMRGKNWIDFEMEISYIIQWIEKKYTDLFLEFNLLHEAMSNVLEADEKILDFSKAAAFDNVKDVITVEDFLNKLYDDLERIARALGIYLYKFVEDIPVDRVDAIEKIKPDYVISFNYTKTYEKVYGNRVIPVCYIHGTCDELLSDMNIVLGIDEYLDEYQRNINTDMAIFKKYIQRIRKRNDTIFRNWSKEIETLYTRQESTNRTAINTSNFPTGHSRVYVYGHSLDVTDMDILELFLKPDYTRLEIYAKGKINEGKLLSNLIKIVGRDTVIEKSNSIPTKIELHVI